MCGRYVVKTPIKTIAKMHRVFDAPLFEPRYNVAPTQTVPIVRAKDGGRELALVRWGLVPAIVLAHPTAPARGSCRPFPGPHAA